MTIWLRAASAGSVCVLQGFSNQGKTFRWSSLECGSVKDAPSGECKLIYGPLAEIGQNTQVLSEGSLLVRDYKLKNNRSQFTA